MTRRWTSISVAALAAFWVAPGHAAGPETVLSEPQVPAPPQLRHDWSGVYGGLTFGVARGDGETERTECSGIPLEVDCANELFPDEIDEGKSDPVFGLTLGFNRQRGSFVGGVEFDISALNQDVAADFTRVDPGPLFPGAVTNSTYRTEMSGLATLRLRAGYALGRNLFYGTAGVAAGQVENAFSIDIPDLFPGSPGEAPYKSPEDWRDDGTRYGYVVGAGVERSLGDRLSIKGEVLYYDLEDVTVAGRDPVFDGNAIDYEFGNDGYVARLGLNFAF